MQALGFFEHGDISQMKLLNVPVPVAKPGEALIQIKASAFNHLDIWVRDGWRGLKLQLPHISGSDAAGVITALGEEVDGFNIGDRVAIDPGLNLYDDEFTGIGEPSVSPGYCILGEQLPGTHAEFIAMPVKNLIVIPPHITFETAAAAGLVTTTAWRMLIIRAKIRPGERVLVLGAGGGVNSMAIQIAKLAGCHVYAISSSDDKVAKSKVLGAEVVLNYHTDKNWAKHLAELTLGEGFDVVVDNVGNATLASSMQLVKRGGRIVIVGNTSGPKAEIDIRYIFGKQISLIGSTMGSHVDYRHAMQCVFDGKLNPPIYTVLPLKQGIEAMRILEHGQQFGKVVLKPND